MDRLTLRQNCDGLCGRDIRAKLAKLRLADGSTKNLSEVLELKIKFEKNDKWRMIIRLIHLNLMEEDELLCRNRRDD